MGREIKRAIKIKKERVQAMSTKPLRNFFRIRKEKKEIQALEGTRDVTTTSITDRATTSKVIDKNNFTTYTAQVSALYNMYEGKASYGGEIARGIVDMRTAFIAGEGISFTTSNKEAEKIITQFIKDNRLKGSRLLRMVETGELEGKNLITLTADNKNKKIKTRSFSWEKNKYKLEVENGDCEDILKIKYTCKGEDKTIPKDRAVYVKLGGSPSSINETPNRIHVVLTDIENMSRAKYDLRKNTHVFGKTMPYFECEDNESAEAINEALASKSFEIGDGYAGRAKFAMIEPTGSAAETIIKDILINLKNISTSTGIPVHWLAWPELMSNRATADNLMEIVFAATKLERLVWEESFVLLFEKMLNYGVDKGFWDSSAIADDIEVKLPAISLALLKQLIEVWQPLKDDKTISLATYRNMVPGIDPKSEKKLVEKERKEAAENSPFQKGVMSATLTDLQNAQGVQDETAGADTSE